MVLRNLVTRPLTNSLSNLRISNCCINFDDSVQLLIIELTVSIECDSNKQGPLPTTLARAPASSPSHPRHKPPSWRRHRARELRLGCCGRAQNVSVNPSPVAGQHAERTERFRLLLFAQDREK